MDPTQFPRSGGLKSYPLEEAIAMETALVKIRATLLKAHRKEMTLAEALTEISRVMPDDQGL